MNVEESDVSDLCRAGLEASKQGNRSKSVEHFELAAAACEQLDNSQAQQASILIELARLYALEERLSDAEKAFDKALALRERSLPEDDPSRLETLREVAMFHHINQNFDRAEKLYQRLLSVREQQCTTSLDIAGTLANLAELYSDQGGFSKAVDVLMRALTIEEQILGHEHTSVGQTYSDLADCLAAMGRFTEAESSERNAFQIFRKVLGPQHAKTSSCMKRTLDLQEMVRRQDAMTKVDVSWQG